MKKINSDSPIIYGLAAIMGMVTAVGGLLAIGMVLRLVSEVFMDGYTFFGGWPL